MKTLFWIAVALESLALGYFLRQYWLLTQKAPDEVYPEMYRKVIIPAVVLFLIVAGALVSKYVFKSDKAALFFAFLPALAMAVSLLSMVVGTMMIGGKWR